MNHSISCLGHSLSASSSTRGNDSSTHRTGVLLGELIHVVTYTNNSLMGKGEQAIEELCDAITIIRLRILRLKEARMCPVTHTQSSHKSWIPTQLLQVSTVSPFKGCALTNTSEAEGLASSP